MKPPLLAMSLALAASANAAAPAFVGFAWEFSRRSVRDLVAYAAELDKTPLDGIGVYLNEPQPDGTTLSTHNIMRQTWLRETLEPLVPVARELTAHRALRESFIGTLRAPAERRIAWDDDAGWATVASNMAIAAWFAREGGFRGLSMDSEDYHGTAQFRRRRDDPSWETLSGVARRRGREVFEGVFREFPDMTVLAFWFLSMDHSYQGSDDPARDARYRGDLWPAFVDGILDAMPPTARIVDGCEHSYRYESSRGDFFRAGDSIRRRLPALIAPENRAKYAAQVSAGFGLYLDMYVNPETSDWYFGPVDGSRLRHFEHNLAQAAEAADGYVWFWGEKRCWGDWGGQDPGTERGILPETWNAAVPGLHDVLLAVKDPAAHAASREAALRSEGRWASRTANPDCRGDADGSVPAPYSTWQATKARKGRLFCDGSHGDGDTFSLAAEGAENGAFTLSVPGPLREGDRYLVSVSMDGKGGSAQLCWKRPGGAWDWDVLPPVPLRFGEPDGRGWRRARAVIRVPAGAAGAGLILSAAQRPGETCHFDNVAVFPLGD